MPVGVYYALLSYAIYACGDAIIKAVGSGVSPFIIGFWTALFSSIPVLLTRPKSEKLVHLFKAVTPWRLHLRAMLSFLAVVCVIFTFTHIPLAEAYALIFLTPVFSTMLAVLILKEEMTTGRWIGLALGFAGVLLVVRPGFRELDVGHFTAIIAAVVASAVAILLRQASQTEQRISILAYSVGYSLVLNGGIVLLMGQSLVPSAEHLLMLAVIGTIGGFGNVLIVLAAKYAPMAWMAPTQYSQIIWAVIFGGVFFSEFPGPFTIAGLCVVAIAGYFSFPPGTGADRGPVGGFAFLTGPRRAKRGNKSRRASNNQTD